jgi:hypothetical protein
MMKLVILSVLLGVAYSAVTKCMTTGSDAKKTVASAACSGSQTKCKKPTFTINGGFADVAYACGACTSDETAKGCEACETDDCNKVPETETYMCSDHEWKTDKWEAKKDKQTCTVLKTVEKKDRVCNGPGKEAKKADAYTVQTNGCGKCLKAELDANKCVESGAAALTAFLVPLLAALYTLF